MPTSVAAAAISSNGFKLFSANGWRTFSFNDKATFVNCPRSLSINQLDCIIFDVLVFVNFKLTDK